MGDIRFTQPEVPGMARSRTWTTSVMEQLSGLSRATVAYDRRARRRRLGGLGHCLLSGG
jgi:hypothetical protein